MADQKGATELAGYRTHLTAEAVRAMLDYDPETGIFLWRHRADRPKKWNARYAGTPAGYVSNGYRIIQVDGRGSYQSARLAWLLVYGVWPTHQVDHINGARNDNRIANLREANNGENNRNRGPQANNKLGLRGVSKWGARWQARIMIDGVQRRIGAFATPEEAAAAYQGAAAVVHGEFFDPARGVSSYKRSR